MDVYINGKKIRADPQKAIGKGGEADIFQVNSTTALKLFKSPRHPDYQGNPQAQQTARDRLQLHQQKLPHFPQNLPSRVITPQALATDKSGKNILGYTMPLLSGTTPLLRYSDRSFRQTGISTETVVQIFQDLHDTISKLHFQQVVIGDFNDLNVLVQDTTAYLIDADSFQFASFPCTVFTDRFVDPLLCDPTANQPILQQAPTADSDWYAFTVMLMQCLLFVNPYGGVYKPKDPQQKIAHAARSLHRITVFHPEVHYPKPAIPYSVLPDELLHYWQEVFIRDIRGEFPRSLLDHLRWTHCLTCGTEHARSVCPNCAQATPGAVKTMTKVRGTVTATRLFQTEGVILQATVEQGQLRWLYHDRGAFRREDGIPLLQGDRNPYLRWWIQGQATWLGYQGQVLRLHPQAPTQRLAVASRGGTELFAVNASSAYWVYQDQLQRQTMADSGYPSSTYVGDVLAAQTHFWVGSRFGLGFYRAANLQVAFVFAADKSGINDRVALPRLPGQLIHANCTFSQDYGWLFFTTQAQGQLHHACVVIQADGSVAATAEARSDTDHWLAIVGKKQAIASAPDCAIANFLLAATDEGIIRVELQQGQLIHTKTFADTEPFVDSSCRLLPANDGLYIVNHQSIQLLKLS
jgi:tRNA A-37 threonylcarbamoyl transferase component Bud32